MLAQDTPRLTGIDTDRWAEERDYDHQNGFQALNDFCSSRLEFLKILDSLEAGDWQRKARHTILGWTDIAEQVRIAADHERLHIRQFLACIKSA
jgi:hypothetical protein